MRIDDLELDHLPIHEFATRRNQITYDFDDIISIKLNLKEASIRDKNYGIRVSGYPARQYHILSHEGPITQEDKQVYGQGH